MLVLKLSDIQKNLNQKYIFFYLYLILYNIENGIQQKTFNFEKLSIKCTESGLYARKCFIGLQ